ncbi:MAG: hypothetical protein QNJ16_11820 [Rhodobacter sp.]|nr:hypothetical protein [Rhodobacter sp.]
MTRTAILTALLALNLLAGTAHAAGYMKVDGVEGQSRYSDGFESGDTSGWSTGGRK